MSNVIKVPLPLSSSQVDEIESIIKNKEDNKIFLIKALKILEQKTEEANRRRLYESASKLAEILRNTSMTIDGLDSQERDNF